MSLSPLITNEATPQIVDLAKDLIREERRRNLPPRQPFKPNPRAPKPATMIAQGSELAPNGLPYDMDRNPRPVRLRGVGGDLLFNLPPRDKSWVEQFPQCFGADGCALGYAPVEPEKQQGERAWTANRSPLGPLQNRPNHNRLGRPDQQPQGAGE